MLPALGPPTLGASALNVPGAADQLFAVSVERIVEQSIQFEVVEVENFEVLVDCDRFLKELRD